MIARTLSQNDRIAAFLKARRRKWVSMVTLHDVSGSLNIHSRIDELRHKAGLVIENKTDRSTRPKKSWYRYLKTEPAAASHRPTPLERRYAE